jgi:hypothetical protein
MKYPNNFRASLRNWKKYDFICRKIVIFHTKYPKIFRTSLRSAQFFLSAPPPNLKSWIRPCNQGYHAECFYFRK